MADETITADDIDMSDILTFDEIIADPYYKAEFDKRVQQALNIKNSHPDVKGGNQDMEKDQTNTQGATQTPDAAAVPPKAPDAAPTPAANTEQAETPAQPDAATAAADADAEAKRGMSAAQFDAYNATLRDVSKLVNASVHNRYNAFEDGEIKAAVKQLVMKGETPSAKELAAGAISRLTPQQEQKPAPEPQPAAATTETAEMVSLKAELALVKAGIRQDRIEAAKTLFIASGADLAHVAEFVAKYPEWTAQNGGGVVFSQAPPVQGKTAPAGERPASANDFERKVAAARKARGLD